MGDGAYCGRIYKLCRRAHPSHHLPDAFDTDRMNRHVQHATCIERSAATNAQQIASTKHKRHQLDYTQLHKSDSLNAY
eukprot:8981-Heterococcus_DN1.PRE.2